MKEINPTVPEGSGRVRFANQLRGLAAFGVVWHHLGVQYWSGKGFAAAIVGFSVPPAEAIIPAWAVLSRTIQAFGGSKARFDIGEVSVALFFLISGFVIPMSLRKLTIPQFAVARFLRIYPTYCASIGLFLFVACVAGPSLGGPGRFEVPALHWLAQALLVVDVFSTPLLDLASWTLLIELKFYVVCACFAAQIRRGRVLPLVCFFAVVAAIATAFRSPEMVDQAASVLGRGTL